MLRLETQVIGKQVKCLCDLVTVFSSVSPIMSLRNREGGGMRYAVSQETCLLWYGNLLNSRLRGLIVPKFIFFI